MSISEETQNEAQADSVREVFREFCSKSTIHGVQYFFERKRHWSERVWWLFAFSLSVWVCGSSIQNVWFKWCNNPVTMTLTEKESPISTIPFPTITICPETKSYSKVLNVTKAFLSLNSDDNNLTTDEMAHMKVLYHMCHFYLDKFSHLEGKFANDSIYDLIKEMAPKLNDCIYSCMWQYKNSQCSQFFVPIFTDDGLCFAFNALNSHEIYTEEMADSMRTVGNNPNVSNWNFESGYAHRFNENDYPIRMFNAHRDSGLLLMVRLFEQDLEYVCRRGQQGYKIILKMPGEFMETSRHIYRVSLGERAELSIKSTYITTSEDLRGLHPFRRQCYFSSERRLRFFKFYTQHNCETECLANYTQIECGCVKFSMPRTNRTKICGPGSVKCYKSAKMKLFGEDIIDGLKNKKARSFREKCICLPACTTIRYEADVVRSKLGWEAIFKSYNIPLDKGMRPSTIMIFFKDHNVVTLQRSALYTYTDFLAICGGLLGLFLGVSTLSIVEFFYYLTLRLYWTIRRRRIQNTVVPFNRELSKSVYIDILN